MITEILKKYNINSSSYSRLGGMESENYKIKTTEKNYVLRIYNSAIFNKTQKEIEQDWMNDLSENSNLKIQESISNNEGESISSYSENNKNYFATLSTWIKGNIPPTILEMDEAELFSIGSTMGTLHKYSKNYSPSVGDFPFIYDSYYFVEKLETLYNTLESDHYNEALLEELKVNISNKITRFSSLLKTPDNWGMIHGDFHSGNYIIDKNKKAHIIDFARCGMGFYAYDFYLALMEMEENQRIHFKSGYEKIMPLPKVEDESIFYTLSLLDNLGTLAAFPEELPFIKKDIPYLIKTSQ